MDSQEGGRGLSYDAVERLIKDRLEAIKERVQANERTMQDVRTEQERQHESLWQELRSLEVEFKKELTEKTRSDVITIGQIQAQLLTRVPAWALTMMTAGASVIGAMAMYILNHMK